jgi:hypothetical protein
MTVEIHKKNKIKKYKFADVVAPAKELDYGVADTSEVNEHRRRPLLLADAQALFQ